MPTEGQQPTAHPRAVHKNLDKAADLVAKYKDWFDGCTDFQVEASRVDRIGKRLGISYRFLLRDHEDWYRIEQQLFCTL